MNPVLVTLYGEANRQRYVSLAREESPAQQYIDLTQENPEMGVVFSSILTAIGTAAAGAAKGISSAVKKSKKQKAKEKAAKRERKRLALLEAAKQKRIKMMLAGGAVAVGAAVFLLSRK
jgi:hypothetical protein